MNQNFSGFTTWSPKEIEIAAVMWQGRFADFHGQDDGPKGEKERVLTAIAERLRRPYRQVWQRYYDQGPSFHTVRKTASDRALAERARRKAAEEGMSLTGILLGDPPPGYSALDKRRAGVVAGVTLPTGPLR